MKKIIFILFVGVVLGGGSILLLKNKGKQQTPSQSSALSEQTQVRGKVVTVSATNFSYDISEIRVKKGEKLTIRFVNSEGTHNIVFEDLNAQSDVIGAGKNQDVSVPTDTAGTFAYFCSVGNHRKMGMEGKLIVE
ncbi:MAG: hypothetical protein A2804_01535 [Candidatus Pacebacteria bacterium RIFCSPHIGHO2_01_FULL_46_10]|nr:MAG: hypothetical protein A2804_01535 [Candidatus Pacebacteria bacterium RIFCSPHIGHO2_01_FULL_46_10]